MKIIYVSTPNTGGCFLFSEITRCVHYLVGITLAVIRLFVYRGRGKPYPYNATIIAYISNNKIVRVDLCVNPETYIHKKVKHVGLPLQEDKIFVL